MAVSSATSTSNIDVAAIVEQLMTVENRPLDVLKAKITQQNTVISDLGVIKGKVSTFQEALRAFQDPTTFNSVSASSTNAAVVGVLASNGAIKGNYSVSVNAVALATKATVSGYASATTSAGIDAGAGFAITIGSTTYNTKGTPAGTAVIGANPTVTDLKNWINALGKDVSASVVQTTANQYSLMIQGTKTGINNAVTFTGLTSPGTVSTIAAQDASFNIDGIAFTRSTNSVSDVLNGVTLNLVKASDTAQTISITKGADVSSAAINTLIKAYNELMSSYKEMTANSSNSSKPGTFANSPTALSFINQIKASFAKGISYTEGGTLKTMSLSTLGIDLQLDGTAKFNSANYATASANGLQDVLALGVAAGYIDSSNNLNTFLTAQVKTGGALDLQIQSENNSVRNLTKRQDDLQTRLVSVQNNLISQYSALNALLFQLNNTSTALTSALDALTNSQKNN
jgi:flagellar hook-associated protein 2